MKDILLRDGATNIQAAKMGNSTLANKWRHLAIAGVFLGTVGCEEIPGVSYFGGTVSGITQAEATDGLVIMNNATEQAIPIVYDLREIDLNNPPDPEDIAPLTVWPWSLFVITEGSYDLELTESPAGKICTLSGPTSFSITVGETLIDGINIDCEDL